MAVVSFPFGKEKIEYNFNDEQLKAVLTSSIEHYEPELSEDELVLEALRNPVGLVRGCFLLGGQATDCAPIYRYKL